MLPALPVGSRPKSPPKGRLLFINPLESIEGYTMEESFLSHFAFDHPHLEVKEYRISTQDLAQAEADAQAARGHQSASSALNLPESRIAEALATAQQPGNAVFTVTWGNKLPHLADGGLISPLADLAPPGLWDDFYPNVMKTVTYKDVVWLLPMEGTPYAVFCNLDFFRRGGVALPTTWQETLAAAQALTQDIDGDGKIDQWGYTQCTYQFPLELFTHGITLVRPDRTVGFADPPAAEVAQMYWALRQCSPPHVEFERGDVAMKLSTYDDTERYRHLDYAVIPIPKGTCRANSVGASGSSMGLAMLKGSDPETAAEFLRFWARPIIHMRWCCWTHTVALRRSVRESVEYRRYLTRVPEMQVFDGELDYAIPRPVMPEYDAIHEIIARMTGRIHSHPGKPTLEQCQAILDDAAAKANALLRGSD